MEIIKMRNRKKPTLRRCKKRELSERLCKSPLK